MTFTVDSLWKYIPKKLLAAIADVNTDIDGYWVYLEPGYRAYDGGEDCGIIHTDTVADLKQDLKTIRYREEWLPHVIMTEQQISNIAYAMDLIREIRNDLESAGELGSRVGTLDEITGMLDNIIQGNGR